MRQRVRYSSGPWPTVCLNRAASIDEPVVHDGQFFTARKPGDLPAELRQIMIHLRAWGDLMAELSTPSDASVTAAQILAVRCPDAL